MVKTIQNGLLKTTCTNLLEANREDVEVLTSPRTMLALKPYLSDTKRTGSVLPKGVERGQVHLGLTCANENASNIKVEVAVLNDTLVTAAVYADLTEAEVANIKHHPFPYSLSGNEVFGQLPQVEEVWLRQVGHLDTMIQQAAPEHYEEMLHAVAAVEITIDDEAVAAQIREQLGPNHGRHLVHLHDSTYRLDVRIRAALPIPGAVSNGTINWQQIRKEALGTNLEDLVVVLTHLDGQDLRALIKNGKGGVSATSPFFSSDKLSGGQFVGFANSVDLTDKRETTTRHSTVGTLYAIAHLVRSILLAEGVDPDSLTDDELERLIRGSLVTDLLTD